ncbi:hypothetical protein D3C81_1252760 [compost metagenome]
MNGINLRRKGRRVVQHELIPRTLNEFFISDLPVILKFPREGEIIIDGANLTSSWTEKGLVFQRGYIGR